MGEVNLRTLKDFSEKSHYYDPVLKKHFGLVDLIELQQAIKWVKNLKTNPGEYDLFGRVGRGLNLKDWSEERIACEAIIWWIMHFFNLTEGDLK